MNTHPFLRAYMAGIVVPTVALLFGVAAFVVVARWKVLAFYVGFLVLQLIVVRHAAATYGIRFVCTVLAQKAGKATR